MVVVAAVVVVVRVVVVVVVEVVVVVVVVVMVGGCWSSPDRGLYSQGPQPCQRMRQKAAFLTQRKTVGRCQSPQGIA